MADFNSKGVDVSSDFRRPASFIPTGAAQFTQQGPKLVGNGAAGGAEQGYSVSLSADGNTAIVGAWVDNLTGDAFVYTRSGGVWTQQGSKLVGTGVVNPPGQESGLGYSVALSGDGNTAMVGGIADNGGIGAAWVYTRSNGAWTQQGSKLLGNDAVYIPYQGSSVALSADGNTAMVGGTGDGEFALTGTGAAWVYTRSNGVWTQQGSKLVGTGAVGIAQQGYSVSLSADGNTAIVGGWRDNPGVSSIDTGTGAAWVYTRSKGAWTQQGSKLLGNDAVGYARQGWSVALSGDGNTAMVGGPTDNLYSYPYGIGAAWVYTRSNGVWTQQGNKLVGTGAAGPAQQQGNSVALSGDGNTAIVGGPYDNGFNGAAWVYVQPPTVPFSAFSAKLNIYFTPNQYGFALVSNFTLGKTSNGINPVTEAVTLQIGTFTITIPPGSFQEPSPGYWTFVGVINGVTLEVVIQLTAPNQYIFGVTAQKVNLIGTQTPVTVTLTIGNDSGTTQAINF